MKLYKGSTNTRLSVTSDCYALLFDVTKGVGATDIREFFGRDNISYSFQSPKSNGETFAAAIPICFLMQYPTVNSGFIKAYKDGTGKITRVVFRIDVGCGGALPFNGDNQLNVTTTFGGLSNAEGSLTIDCIAADRTNLLNRYDYQKIDAAQMKTINVSESVAAVFPSYIRTLDIYTDAGISYQQSIEALKAVAQANNETAVQIGTEVDENIYLAGDGAPIKTKVFKATESIAGGEAYLTLGVSHFKEIKIMSEKEAGILLITPVPVF